MAGGYGRGMAGGYVIWQAMGAYIKILVPYYLLFVGHMWPCIGYTLSYVFDTKHWKI